MKRIAELRKERHISQTELGRMLNLSQKMISSYESGTHQPGLDTLKKLSRIFGVSVDYIIENSDSRSLPVTDGLSLYEDEVELLSMYRQLDIDSKHRALGITFALLHYDDPFTIKNTAAQ